MYKRQVPSDVALEYRQYFQEILTDEYQDSNLVQEYLLSALSGEVEGHYKQRQQHLLVIGSLTYLTHNHEFLQFGGYDSQKYG